MDEDISKQIGKRYPPAIAAVLWLAIFLIGLKIDIYLLWIFGAIGVGLYSILTIVDTFIQLHRANKKYPLFMYPPLIIFRLAIVFSITPIVLFLPLLLGIIVGLIVFSFNAVARKNILRRALIITGFILIVTGISIEIAII